MRLNPQTYALSAVCHERRRIFQRTANVELLITTILRYRDQGHFLLHAFVIMPDHIHILLTPSESIEKTAQLIKGGFSFAVRKQYAGEIWQSGYHAHRVTDAEDYTKQSAYIANNPVRKNYINYPYVHTTETWPLDETPIAFRDAIGRPSPGG
jgi:putative transposase